MNIIKTTLVYTFLLLIPALSVQAGTIKGKITDQDNSVLSGVNILIENEGIGSTTNEFGNYFFENLSDGNYNLTFTYVGYKTVSINLELQDNANLDQDIVLEEDILNMGSIVVTAQKKAEQIQDVPVSLNLLDRNFIELNSQVNLEVLDGYVPGFSLNTHSSNRPNFVIRGLTSDAFLASAQPRVSVFYNNIPISRTSGALVELYDMERIEVLRGPQGTLFGRGAQIGAVHYLSNKPNHGLHGNVSMGFGDHGQNYYNAMINLPLSDNLFARLAGTYVKRNGFVTNTFGGDLNERNTAAIRSSFRYISSNKTILDLLIEYQQDKPGGTAFMSKTYPNQLGQINVFGESASFERGSDLGLKRNVLNISFTGQHYFNTNLDLTTILSYRAHDADELWDGDGSAAPSLDFSELIDTDQITFESRLNYQSGKRFKGFAGLSYWTENVKQTVRFSPNEQNLFFLFFDPSNFVDAIGNPNFMPALPPLPELGPIGGAPLTTYHVEEYYQKAVNSALELFIDGTYQVTRKLNFTVGLRAIADRLSLEGRNKLYDGDPATLGFITGNYPNVLIAAGDIPIEKKDYTSIVGRAIVHYTFSESLNAYASYSRGRRPHVIQVRADAQTEILEDEKVNSFDLGFKGHLSNRFLYDLTAYYYDYSDFQTRAWVSDQESGEFQLIVKDGGKAEAYGFETNLQYAFSQHVQLFANYAYIHARFNDVDESGNEQDYAGNRFRLTPDHMGSLRANLRFMISNAIDFYFTPSYVYKSHHYFEDSNEEGLEQDAFGLLHLQTGIYFNAIHLEVSLFGYNLLNENYLVSAGNTGNLFGIPTFVPGNSRTAGFNFKYNF
jgi:outer membrane receptor protein involved in Fe transport